MFALGGGGVLLTAFGYGVTELGGRPIGWAFVAAGLFITAVAAGIVATGRHYLVMDEFGIRVVGLARTVRYEWSEFAAFAVAPVPLLGTTSVVFELTPEARASRSRMVGFERLASGHDAGLPDTYGMTAEDLCELLAAEQRRHLGGRHVRERAH